MLGMKIKFKKAIFDSFGPKSISMVFGVKTGPFYIFCQKPKLALVSQPETETSCEKCEKSD